MLLKKRSNYTITAPEMRAINRTSILEFIRCSRPISRSHIAKELGVSLPTVMRIVDGLISEGLVVETGVKEWSGGRKRALVKFNGSDHFIIGIDLGGTKIFGAVADLNGDILQELYFEHHQTRSVESLQVVCHVIDELQRVATQKGLPVRGIGIGVPGIIIPETGVVSFAPALEWQDFPLKARLQERYSYPIVIENDVNLAALGEVWFGLQDCGEKNVVLIAIGTGIGAGIVINGSVYSGIHHMAGEIGYLLLDRSHLGQKYPGFGAFEQLASGTGIADRARLAVADQYSVEQRKSLTAEDVFSAARRHERWAETILSDTVDYLAQAIAAIAVMYDPGVILLGGGVSRSADLLIDPILQRLEGVIPILPKLLVSRLGYRAAVMGAIIQLLRITSQYYVLQKYM
jgi:glucokinase-like ROK family protein